MPLFSLVLIYLSGLALNTLISCLLSFLLPVSVKPTSQVIFLLRMLVKRLRATFSGRDVVSVRPVAASPSSAGPLATQQPLSPEASPPSEPKGNGVTREDRNRERERRGRLKRNEDDSGNER